MLGVCLVLFVWLCWFGCVTDALGCLLGLICGQCFCGLVLVVCVVLWVGCAVFCFPVCAYMLICLCFGCIRGVRF